MTNPDGFNVAFALQVPNVPAFTLMAAEPSVPVPTPTTKNFGVRLPATGATTVMDGDGAVDPSAVSKNLLVSVLLMVTHSPEPVLHVAFPGTVPESETE